MIQLRAPRAAPVKHKKHRRRHSSGGLGLGGGARWDLVLGAAALGFAAKQGLLARIPTFFGMGPITNFGVATFAAEKFFKLRMPELVRDAGLAARVIAGFEFGRGGTLVGQGLPAAGGAAVFY